MEACQQEIRGGRCCVATELTLPAQYGIPALPRLRIELTGARQCRIAGGPTWEKHGAALAKIRRKQRAETRISGTSTLQTPYTDRLRQWLEADARWTKQYRRSALALLRQLQAIGYASSYSRFNATGPNFALVRLSSARPAIRREREQYEQG